MLKGLKMSQGWFLDVSGVVLPSSSACPPHSNPLALKASSHQTKPRAAHALVAHGRDEGWPPTQEHEDLML